MNARGNFVVLVNTHSPSRSGTRMTPEGSGAPARERAAALPLILNDISTIAGSLQRPRRPAARLAGPAAPRRSPRRRGRRLTLR